MQEYLPLVNLFLNLLILPLMGILWSIRIELARVDARLTTLIEAHGQRILRLETVVDKGKL